MSRDTRIRTLLVEPCPTARASLATTLADCGCDVTAAAADREAYESHVTGNYALAVVAVDRMPDQGFWLCRRLRAAGRRGEPVILALSDRWEAGRLAWLLEAGVDDCLTTPPDEASLSARVNLARQRLGLGQLDDPDDARTTCFFHDAADRKHAEALYNEQESLRRMLELFERDRELIAFEIHDGLSQQLTGALLHFEGARRAHGCFDENARKSFNFGLNLLRESINEARRLVRGLRPPVLDAFGVVPAIEHLIEDHHTAGGGRVEFSTSNIAGRLAPPLESALFRTVQETLNNARKYSRSDRIRIQLSQDPDHVSVEIRDWGVGFDPDAVGDDHYGLRGIRERARLLGGTALIDARPGEGTRIRVELPRLEGVTTPPQPEEPAKQ